jgi:micrococcal nuclease
MSTPSERRVIVVDGAAGESRRASTKASREGVVGDLAVVSLALWLALAAAACGGGTTTPGASGGAPGPGSATPAPIPGAPDRPTGPTQDAVLVRIVDGDTIRVMVGGIEERVRYIGIDTPELNTSSPATPDPYAEAATEANAQFLAGGRLVLEKDVS